MWKLKDYERSAEEWATIAECIAVYMSMVGYPSVEVVASMLGIVKEASGTDEA